MRSLQKLLPTSIRTGGAKHFAVVIQHQAKARLFRPDESIIQELRCPKNSMVQAPSIVGCLVFLDR
jgi:hypothetical protein